jgi:hypothetical protein
LHFRNNSCSVLFNSHCPYFFSLAEALLFIKLQNIESRFGGYWSMSVDRAPRGRPKGSGLDDRALLNSIRQRLEGDPSLRPTTAIKALGISDPATIRRLRDKLRGAKKDARPATAPIGADVSAVTETLRGGAAGGGDRYAVLVSARSGTTASGEAQRIAAASPDDAMAWLAQWCGLGLHALSTTVEAHIAAIETLLSVPQVASALRQQMLLNQQMMSFCASSRDVRKTLH